MKTLKDHVILYDAVCPMCNLYTQAFVKSGMLDQDGRMPYQDMPANFACVVDQKRAVNEIALVHTPTGKVYYGVESLFKIVGYSCPLFAPLFRLKAFIKITDKLYKFISFNRRVIAPSKRDEIAGAESDPAFHRGYRILYLIFAWLLTAFILHKYSLHLADTLPHSSFYREFVVCGGQMIWQATVVLLLKKGRGWDYLGNLMTISLAGGLLLLLVMIVGKIFQWQNPVLYASLFGAVVVLMFFEHIRRTKLLQLGWMLTASWVLYRVLVLFIILMASHVG